MPQSERPGAAGRTRLVLIIVAVVVAAIVAVGIPAAILLLQIERKAAPVRGARARVTCLNHLRLLCNLVLHEKRYGELNLLPGAGLFLQFEEELEDEDLSIYLCLGDTEAADFVEDPTLLTRRMRADLQSAPCSYRGPDEHLLRSIELDWDAEGVPTIVACDRNGPNGDEPYHARGVCVVYNTGDVDFILWEDMEGYAGGPVRIGPGSPDPRFQHLIR